MELILEANGDAIAGEGPEFFAQAVIEFTRPLAPEQFDDRGATADELDAIAPLGIFRVSERDAFRIAGIPAVFGKLDFQARGFLGERRQRRAGVHAVGWVTCFEVYLSRRLGRAALMIKAYL